MKKRLKSIFIINLIFVFFDFLSKLFIKKNFYFFTKKTIINGFLDIVYVKNRGIAFGFLKNISEPLRKIFLIYLPLAIIFVILVYILYSKKISKIAFLGFNLIIAGAIGNLIDRCFYGYVVDFIDCYYKNYHWPAFNFADSYITIGTFLLILDSLLLKKKGK